MYKYTLSVKGKNKKYIKFVKLHTVCKRPIFRVQSGKRLHWAEKIYTGTACGACDKYEVCKGLLLQQKINQRSPQTKKEKQLIPAVKHPPLYGIHFIIIILTILIIISQSSIVIMTMMIILIWQRGVISNSRPLAAAEGRSHVLSVTATDCGGNLTTIMMIMVTLLI